MAVLIFIFRSSHHVLKAEKLLISRGIRHEIIPTPKDISMDCGMSIRVNSDLSDPDAVKSVLNEHNIFFKIAASP